MSQLKKIRKAGMVLGTSFFLFMLSCDKNPHPPELSPRTSSVDIKVIADGFVSPVSVVEPPDSSHRLFVVDQPGKVWIIDSTGKKLAVPFLDLSRRVIPLASSYDEKGLLSIAFHPDYKNNGLFYAFYTAPPLPGGPAEGGSWNNLTVISEFKVSQDANIADPATERIVLTENHPQANHNGGTLAFGPDGYLYISIGDGGNADDAGPGHASDWYAVNKGGNGQDIFHNLLGNILRINVNTTSGYAIPSDNPFVAVRNAKPEIFAYGFRNPYRFSFDIGGDHALYVGDVGQSLYEEIDIVSKGGNYGWNVKEGKHCFSTENDKVELNACPMMDSLGNPFIDPIIELKNYNNPSGGGLATAIIGGNVYRGSTLPAFEGKYIFGIYSQDGIRNAKIYSATGAPGGTWSYEPISFKSFPDHLGQYLKGFGQDSRGEIYLATSGQE
ncbi:MAG: PQQ-dependent sugar dehydrogenase, partial [Bacteroidota bacterium]